MLSLMCLSAALAFEPPAPEPEISNGFRAEQPETERHLEVEGFSSRSVPPPVTAPTNPEPEVRRVFLTDETTVSLVWAAIASCTAEASTPQGVPLDDWPLPVNDLEAALVMVNAWQTPQGSWRIRGGEPWLRVDDVFLRSTME